MKTKIQRDLFGLSNEEVLKRVNEGKINIDTSIKTKTNKQIIRENIFTLFNVLNFIFAILLIVVGSFKDLFFMWLIVVNSVIGIVQEIRSKNVIDKLSLLALKKVNVIRNGKEISIGINDIVIDDIMVLRSGNQIAADAIVIKNECEVNESLLTGEADSVTKSIGETLFSGSYLSSGEVMAKVIHVGEDNYVAQISKDAKKIKRSESQIMKAINRIVAIVSVIIIPLGIMFFIRQFNLDGFTFSDAVVHTVAALIVMVPQGLVLLTSVVLAISVIRLAKHKVLVQDLYSIESLARTDIICLDKTGTITEGSMIADDVIGMGKYNYNDALNLLGSYASSINDSNPTINAIREIASNKEFSDIKEMFSFSSDKKYSAIALKKGGYVLGAPDFIGNETKKEQTEINEYSKDYRVLGLYKTEKEIKKNCLPDDLSLICLVLLKDKIRYSAKKVLDYFKNEGVGVKIISGDHVSTVVNIARVLEINGYEKAIDLSSVKTDEELEKAAIEYTIFGRVTPLQKKKLVIALKNAGHTVAMTGDGVNDVMALKEADCGIAMAAGSDAARNVSELVLLDNDFDSMPKVVDEGRRSINNIERSASLFLSKTIYATLLIMFFLFVTLPYPFKPIQLTLVDMVVIGIPSFILALEKNTNRVKGKFSKNILYKSLPTALMVFFNIVIFSILQKFNVFDQNTISTLAIFSTAFIGFELLYTISEPFNNLRTVLFFSMIILFSLQFIFLHDFYSIAKLSFASGSVAVVMMIVDNYLYKYVIKAVKFVIDHINFKKEREVV
ncbi:MAG: HAD-IC family P-type ATPase [Bacilli bacterium]